MPDGPKTFKIVYIDILGFTENATRYTGGEKCWERVYQYSSDDVLVIFPIEWNADWKEIAAMVARHTDENSLILVKAYSWGFGHGLMRLDEELEKLERNIWFAVIVDGVRRWKHTPTRPKFLAGLFNPQGVLGSTDAGRRLLRPVKISPNVRMVEYFRQKENVPTGRQLIAEDDEETLILDPVWLKLTHAEIDDAPEVIDAAERMVVTALDYLAGVGD